MTSTGGGRANRASKLVLNHSSMECSLSSVESGRGSETAWRSGPDIESRGCFDNLVVSASDRRRLRRFEFVKLWVVGTEHGI